MNANFEEWSVETLRKLEDPGLLLVSTNRQGKNNVMTIGWGLVGVFWGKPVLVVSVRPACYSHEFIEDSGEFTINVPEEGMKDVVQYCGEVSGRDCNKITECKLNMVKSKFVRPPIIEQCKLHYECRVVHTIDIIPRLAPLKFFIRVIIAKIKGVLYIRDNYRSLYFGEILAIY